MFLSFGCKKYSQYPVWALLIGCSWRSKEVKWRVTCIKLRVYHYIQNSVLHLLAILPQHTHCWKLYCTMQHSTWHSIWKKMNDLEIIAFLTNLIGLLKLNLKCKITHFCFHMIAGWHLLNKACNIMRQDSSLKNWLQNHWLNHSIMIFVHTIQWVSTNSSEQFTYWVTDQTALSEVDASFCSEGFIPVPSYL